jgi:hypothetical protein
MRPGEPTTTCSPKPIELHLCAIDAEMSDAWSTCFDSAPNVFIHQQDILTRTADAILSPANSFGFMDGGIDLLYSNFFGGEIQDRLQKSINAEHAGEVPIGCAVPEYPTACRKVLISR